MDNSEDLDEEMLIALVRQHRELYDCTLPKYSDVVRKEKIWNEIADQICQPVQKCRERWSNLRGSFRRAYRDHKGINDNKPRRRSRRWKYEKQMEFLIPFLKIKYDSFDHHDLRSSGEMVNTEISIKNEASSCSPRSFEVDYPDSFSLTSTLENKGFVNRATTAAASYDPFTGGSGSSPQHHFNPFKLDRENDALRNFFAYLAETVRTFPPFMQVLAKSKCFNIISEMEIGLVKENPDQCVVPQIMVEEPPGETSEHVRETSVLINQEHDGGDSNDDDEQREKKRKIENNGKGAK